MCDRELEYKTGSEKRRLRHFTADFVDIRQKSSFDATWSCLLFFTAVLVWKIDVIPDARIHLLKIKVCIWKTKMGKPKKKSECVTKL